MLQFLRQLPAKWWLTQFLLAFGARRIPEIPRSALEKSWVSGAAPQAGRIWHTCQHQVCFPPIANRLQRPHNVSPSVTDVQLSRPWWEHDAICILQVFFKKCSSLQCSHHQFPSLFTLSLSVLLLLYTHNRFDACLYARHGCLVMVLSCGSAEGSGLRL